MHEKGTIQYLEKKRVDLNISVYLKLHDVLYKFIKYSNRDINIVHNIDLMLVLVIR